jgi:hypothetical protein
MNAVRTMIAPLRFDRVRRSELAKADRRLCRDKDFVPGMCDSPGGDDAPSATFGSLAIPERGDPWLCDPALRPVCHYRIAGNKSIRVGQPRKP